jgi:bifunctional non-homologous end joining protein LigD
MPAVWVKPKWVCEISFQEWTKEGIMRQPIFQGIREDKPARSVKREETVSLDGIGSNLDKVYWPEDGYTKGDLLAYYEKIAPYILPHLKDRPIVLHRFPNGIEGEAFFQKDAPQSTPSWLKTIDIQHSHKVVRYFLVPDLKSLLYVVNLGSIEIHPFLTKYQHLDEPDFLVIDLDPENCPFKQVIEVAQAAHDLFDSLGIKHFCKTSGKRGLHIFIPLDAKYPFEAVEDFAKLLAQLIHEQLPKITSLIRDPKLRQKKVYVDFLQNGKTKTVVAPYSVRPVEGAAVSTPLDWKEVKSGLDPKEFTIETVIKRIAKKKDLFAGVLGKGISIEAALKKIDKYSGGKM